MEIEFEISSGEMRSTITSEPNSRRATRRGGGGEGGGPPYPFFKIKKGALILKKKCPDCVHPLVKFAIQNVVLRVSKRKNSKIFPCGAFFLDFLIKCLSKYPNFTKPPLPWKISSCVPEKSKFSRSREYHFHGENYM